MRDLAGRSAEPSSDREVMVAPPFTGLYEAVKAAEGTCVSVAAQDVFWEWEGAYTGEVSAAMLADLGVKAAIIGHSERRQYFGETDDSVAKKVWAALERGLLPIMCVGETEEEREAGSAETVLARQVCAGWRPCATRTPRGSPSLTSPCGPSARARPRPPRSLRRPWRSSGSRWPRCWAQEAAEAVRILYGGSVGPNNIDELMARPDIDGVLVGGASLQLGSFARIVQFERP